MSNAANIINNVVSDSGVDLANLANKTTANTFTNTTESTSDITGAIVVAGGVGISKNLHVGGETVLDGDLRVNGTQYITNQSNLAIASPFAYLNANSSITVTFTGTGINNMTMFGVFEGTTSTTYYVKIDGVGTPNTFAWSKNNFTTTIASNVNITGSPQLLDNGVYVDFVTTTGHTLNDVWNGLAAPILVDTGMFTNRNTGATGIGYTHMGVFYDVSTNKWTFLDQYAPEPNGAINIADASVVYGTLKALTFEGALVGNASTVTNGVYTTGSYADPSWITSLAYSKITGTPSFQAQLNGTGFVKASGTTITYDNSTYYLASNPSGYTTNVGTVTSVAALTLGTTGTDVSSSVATGTTTPVITLNIPTASAANRGALSSADWSTFNGKESALTFSSPLSRSVNAISIPVATTSVNGYLSSTDWTTFNGKQAALNGTGFVKISGTTISYDNSTYYLASNPSGYTNNTGTVTTLSVVSANGFAGTVATATTTPAITLSTTITGLLKGNGTAISAAIAGTDYQAPISLTTTGTSGAATLIGTTLNIPQYSGGGGGGTPGGTVNEVQYNDGAGGFAGAANVEINTGNLKLVSTTDPAIPTGGIIMYSKIVGGRHLPKIMGTSGVDTIMQVGLHGNSVMMIAPANATTAPTIWGGLLTTATTISHQQTIASANPWQATRRTRFQTSGTAGNAAGMRTGYTQWFRGSVSGYGGFWFRAQLGMNINLNGGQKFVGLCNSTAVLGGEPSALLNMCGMGYDAADASTGSWFFMYNDGTGTATKVSLGANALRNTNDGYDLVMFMAPGGSELFVRIVNLHTNVTVLETSYTTLLPVANTGMAFKADVRNGAVASADNIEVAKVYIETDF
jgi:hypothetical protein